jgi:hypothetical protein
MSSTRRISRGDEVRTRIDSKSTTDDGPRPLKEREIVNLFMSAGIFENVARSIMKNCPEMFSLTDKTGEDFKSILREVKMIILFEVLIILKKNRPLMFSKEKVSPLPYSMVSFQLSLRVSIIFLEPSNKQQVAVLSSDGTAAEVVVKSKVALCKICKDSAAIHPAYPDKMKKYFKEKQVFAYIYLESIIINLVKGVQRRTFKGRLALQGMLC